MTAKRLVKRADIVQPTDPGIRHIALTRGQIAIVDAADYDWLMQWNWHAAITANGFYARRIEPVNRFIYMHRAIMGASAEIEVDHIESDKMLDNRRSNLRLATSAQNQCNTKRRTDNTSGYKGVSWYKRDAMWRASVQVAGNTIFLGSFTSNVDAAHAYNFAAIVLHGEYAQLNDISIESTPDALR